LNADTRAYLWGFRERVLVNNAGVFRFGAFTEITEESFHLYYNIDVLGTILTAQERSSGSALTA
jgi:NAD(P)-dependent dehydrogenase (short-subunit alcohol dehydrogenase family)